jgi:hypothetical protein
LPQGNIFISSLFSIFIYFDLYSFPHKSVARK